MSEGGVSIVEGLCGRGELFRECGSRFRLGGEREAAVDLSWEKSDQALAAAGETSPKGYATRAWSMFIRVN
jgi:hypothetical protein